MGGAQGRVISFHTSGYNGGMKDNETWEVSSARPDSDLQRLVDSLFEAGPRVSQLDAILLAESRDLDSDVLEVVGLMPPGTYARGPFCDQMNSIITAHGWGSDLGTVR